jgi:glycosyltransferase involved in cell wall biosynthesis
MREAGAMKAPVTAIVQTANMADSVRPCLESLRWVDDLLVVDDHSGDATPDICRDEFGARVLTHKRENAAAQKNWAIPQARHEWVLVVDADEKVTPDLAAEVERVIASDRPFDCYRVQRWNIYFGKTIRHCGWNKDRPIRLFRRGFRYEDKSVHADVIVDNPARLGFIQQAMLHTPYRSFEHYLETFNKYSTWGAEDLMRRGVKPSRWRTVARPAFRFLRQYVLQAGFLDGSHGLHLCMWSAASVYAKYAKLWEMTLDRQGGKDDSSSQAKGD